MERMNRRERRRGIEIWEDRTKFRKMEREKEKKRSKDNKK